MRRTIINITAQTKNELEQLKKDYADNPNCSNEQFLIELIAFVKEKAKESQ